MIDRRAFLVTVTAAPLLLRVRAEAQTPGKMPRVGWLTLVGRDSPQFKAFADGLQDAGYVIGRNVAVDARAPQRPDNLEEFAELATQLVTSGPDVIYAGGPFAVQALVGATKTIPIVAIELESDPVSKGWVASLARPGRNITGFFLDIPEMSGKLLQFLKEAKPNLTRVAVLGHPRLNELQFQATEIAAQRAGLTLQLLPANRLNEIEDMIADAARQRAGALVALSSPLVLASVRRIADAAVKHQFPAICLYTPVFAEVGGLLAYGPDFPDLFRRTGGYVARILKGANPADLPIQRPEKFDLVINLKTARALKLDIPQSLVNRAERVIQ